MYYTAILRRRFTLREADYRGRRAELLPHNCWLMYCGSSSALRRSIRRLSIPEKGAAEHCGRSEIYVAVGEIRLGIPILLPKIPE